MLPTPIPAPFDSPDYAFEVKWDGVRCLCWLQDGAVRLYSRTGRDITAHFPELQDAAQALGLRAAVLDGEICVLAGGVPRFHLVQKRILLSSPAAVRRAAARHPAAYMVFDLLEGETGPIVDRPWRERRAALEERWRGNTPHTALSPVVPGRGQDLYAASIAQGLEGIVAKRADSPYVPGRRTRHWLKVQRRQELDGVIGGYVPRGALDFKSLALGVYPPGNGQRGMLIYVGNVGTGFSAETRSQLMRRLLPLRTAQSPFAATPAGLPPMQWVRPRLVARVDYLERTPHGQLRQPVFRGLRDDKAPEDCVLPPGNGHV